MYHDWPHGAPSDNWRRHALLFVANDNNNYIAQRCSMAQLRQYLGTDAIAAPQ